MGLLRSVVEYASSKGPCLRLAVYKICRTLTAILNQLVQITWLQNGCIFIFTTILSVPSYWPSIKPMTHINLVRLYRSLLQNYPVSDTAAGNARIFRLLFSTRIPSINDSPIGIPQVAEGLTQLINEEILPLRDFARRTNPKALHEFVGALNRLLSEAGPSMSHILLGPLMTHFNDLLISYLSKARPDPNIVTYFRLQLRLLVTPDGRFDSGFESPEEASEDVKPSTMKTKGVKSHAEDPETLYRARDPNVLRSAIIGEEALYNAVVSLVGVQNTSTEAMKSSKIGSLESDLYSLYQLAIALFLKKIAYKPYASYIHPNSMKKAKIEDDPRLLLHSLIFDTMSPNSEAIESAADRHHNNGSPSAKLAYIDLVKRDKPHAHLLSWLQLTFVLLSENVYFFNKSWSLKFVCDLLVLLEYNSGVPAIEVWIYRLLSILASTTKLHRDQPLEEGDEEGTAFSEPDTLGTSGDLDDLQGELNELLSVWKRVWSVAHLKLGHIDLNSGEAALSLLEKLVRFDLVSKPMVLASQSNVLRLPIISEYNSWDAISFLSSIAEKYALVGTGHRNQSCAEVILAWFDGALGKSYSDAVFKSESMVDPSLLASLLLTAITGTPTDSSDALRRDSCFILQQQLQSSELEVSIRQFASSRLLAPHLDPYRRFCAKSTSNEDSGLSASSSSTIFDSGVSQRQHTSSTTSKITVDHMPLSEAKKTELANQLSKILSTRLGQTKSDSPVQTKRKSFVLDGSKLIQLVKKQVFQGCLLVSLLLKLPASRSPLHNELETQLRELSELIESNLKLCEGDAAVAGSIYREISRLALSAAPRYRTGLESHSNDITYAPAIHSASSLSRQSYLETSILQSLFGSLLDSAKSLVSSISAPSRSGSSAMLFSSQTAPSSSQREASSSSLSRVSMDVEEDPYMNIGFENEQEDDPMDLTPTAAAGSKDTTLSRQATELVLSPTSSSIVMLNVPISSRMQCFVQASWVESTILAALPSGHRLLPAAAQALVDAAATLANADIDAHYPLITKLLFGLSLRSSDLSNDQMDHSIELLASILPSLAISSVTLSSYRDLVLLLEAASKILDSAKTRRNGAEAPTTSSSSLGNRSLHNSAPATFHAGLCTVFATSIFNLGKIPWRARLALQKPIAELLALDPSEIGGDEIYNALQTRLVAFLEDVDVRVRAAASHSVCALFSYFSAHRTIVSDLLKSPIGGLLDLPTHLEAIATCLTALQAISSESPLVLDSVLFALHEACTKHHVFTSYVPIILDTQSSSLGYSSRLDMLLDRLPLVFSGWDKLLQFPSFLYNEHDIISFTSKYSGLLVQGLIRPALAEVDEPLQAPVLQAFPQTQLEEIAKIASTSTKALLKGSSDAVLSVIILLQAANQTPSANSLEALSGLVKPAKRSQLASFNLVSNIFHLLRMVGESLEVSELMVIETIEESFKLMFSAQPLENGEMKASKSKKPSEPPQTPIFSPNVLVSALELLASHLRFTSAADILALNNYHILAHVLKSTEEWYFRTNDPTERARAVFAVRAIASRSPLHSFGPVMLLSTLLRFLHNASHPRLLTVILVSITQLWQHLPETSAATLLRSSSFLGSLIDALAVPINATKRIETYSSDAQSVEASVEKLLRQILFVPSSAVQASIALYGRLPGFLHPIFAAINASAAESDTEANQWDFIFDIANTASDASSAKVLTLLDQFIEGAHLYKDAISFALASKADIVASDIVLPWSSLAGSIRSIVRLSKRPDFQVQMRVAEALGVVGIFDASILEPNDVSSIDAAVPLLSKDEVVLVEEVVLGDKSSKNSMEIDAKSGLHANPLTVLDIDRLRTEILACLRLSSKPSKHAFLPLLQLLSLKERSPSYTVSGISRGILNRLVTAFCTDLELSNREDVNFYVSCWRNISELPSSNYLRAKMLESKGEEVSNIWDSALKMASYEAWITSTCAHLSRKSDDAVLQACYDLLATDAEFAEIIFPLLLMDVYQRKGEEMDLFELFLQRATEQPVAKVIARRRHFTTILTSLQAIRTATISRAKDAALNPRSTSRGSQHTESPMKKSRTATAQSLVPSFVFTQARTSFNVATLARSIDIPCTALAFFEHWCETLAASSTSNSTVTSGTLRMPDDPNASSMALSLAQSIFGALGDTESAYGLHHIENSLNSLDSTSLSFLLMQERNWPGVINLFEVCARPSAEVPSRALHRNMLSALQNSGHFEIMRNYVSGLMSRPNADVSEDFSEFHYQAAWRLSDWNATWATATQTNPNDNSDASASDASHSFPFHRLAFTSLRTALQGDRKDAQQLLDLARVQLVQSELSFISRENRAQIQPIVSQLQFFTDIQQALQRVSRVAAAKKPSVAPSRSSIFSSSTAPSETYSSSVDLSGVQALAEWNQSLEAMRKATDRVELFEPLIALRGILLPHILSTQHQHEAQSSYWTSVLVASRKSKNFQLASVALENARSSLQSFHKATLQGPTFKRVPSSQVEGATAHSHYISLSRRFAIEECRFYWFQDKQTEAIALAKAQLKVLERAGQSYDLAKLLLLVGEWLGDSKIESPNVIIDQYLRRASDILRDLKQDASIRCKAYFDLGSFADHQYQLGIERMSSMEWNETMALQKKIQSEQTGIVDDRSRKTHATLYKEEITTPGREQQEQRVKEYLNVAVSMYLYALLKGQKRDTRAVFRIVSLWFSHSSEPRLATTIKNNITKVSSFKFLPLFYQIASRIASAPTQNEFQKALQDLIIKITVDHPHPSFYQLFALMQAGEDGIGKTAPSTVDKSKIADRLITQVRARIPTVVDGMTVLAISYIELANHKFPKDVGASTKLPTKALLSWKHPGVVPVATTATTAKTSGGYYPRDSPDVVHIDGFEASCKFVGGVNLPRLIRCRGSDGKSYPQLVKGKDDLRQDAVMQQLFHTINVLLKTNAESSLPNLRIRTYNVIPLSPSAGVLEWVSNTQPLGDYLISISNGAHIRYRPQDWIHTKCRETMDRASRLTEEQRFVAYQEVLKNFRPVLHHFFIENFPEPGVWYEKRLSYTRSMAVASIVGHMVGLGDRHSQNILMDKGTGEVVHIDLGIAFDRGKTLPVPELVPFRLTRDLVDALGVVGVRGIFTKSCENVVRTLREHHTNLVTIAQVFLHDPLSNWLLRINANAPHERTGVIDLEMDESTEPLAVMKPGGLILEENGSRNTKAASTLLRFKQKLLGQEEGVALSVAGQVQHLITAAQDERKLALMYPGWASWV